MMLFEKVGNYTIYTENFTIDNSIAIYFYNGSDLIASDTYFNTTPEKAVADLFSKALDIYTESFVHNQDLVRLSNNTFHINEKDWFCRIDDTIYFKHYYKSANEFIKDKNSNRIIDR